MIEKRDEYDGTFIIIGLTKEGKLFRPSDWAERLAGVLSMFGGGVLSYSPYVRPIATDGVKGVLVDAQLKSIEPSAYQFLLNFAYDNGLEIREVCIARLPSDG